MKNLKIYLCDFVHNYFRAPKDTYTVPLNIGLIGANVKKKLGTDVDVRLFKYPDRLIEAVKSASPHIIGFSSYMWNENLSLHIAKMMKINYPRVLTVIGGPNIDPSLKGLQASLQNHPCIDYIIPFEGEQVFGDIACTFLDTKSIEALKKKKSRVRQAIPTNCITRRLTAKSLGILIIPLPIFPGCWTNFWRIPISTPYLRPTGGVRFHAPIVCGDAPTTIP